jgi:hypothetical protein
MADLWHFKKDGFQTCHAGRAIGSQPFTYYILLRKEDPSYEGSITFWAKFSPQLPAISFDYGQPVHLLFALRVKRDRK